jgi:ParB family chromosome partitioning protein
MAQKNRFSGMTKQMNKAVSKSDLTVSQKDNIIELDIDEIEMPPFHDRHSVNSANIKELAEDISIHGIINPISVRRLENGKYQRISGYRRIQAYKLLGKNKIKAICFDNIKSNLDVIELMFSENHHRENPSEYDIIIFHLEGLSYMLNKKDSALRTVISQARKIELGTLQTEDTDLLKEVDIVKDVLNKTKTFNTINSFYQKMNNILALNPILIDAIKERKIYYSIAVELNKAIKSDKTINDINNFLADSIIQNYSLKETKDAVKKFMKSAEKVLTDLEDSQEKLKTTFKKIISKLDLLTDKDLNEMNNYLSELLDKR